LIYLSAIIRYKKREQIYRPLTDALRKIQWVKLYGYHAINIENEIARQMEPEVLIFEPIGQIIHAMSVTNLVVHTKSALDSIAIFLTQLYNIKIKGGDRDLKKKSFREQVAVTDLQLGKEILTLERWLDDLQAIRDEWLHRTSMRSIIIYGPSEVGIMPVPKKLSNNYEKALQASLTRDNFSSIKEFAHYHYYNLTKLFNAIVQRAIQIESQDLSETIPKPDQVESQLAIFPVRVNKTTHFTRIKIGRRTASFISKGVIP